MVGSDGPGQHASRLSEPGGPELKDTGAGRSLGSRAEPRRILNESLHSSLLSPKTLAYKQLISSVWPSVLLRPWKKQMQFGEQNKKLRNCKLQRAGRIHSIYETMPGYSKNK